MPKNSHPSTPPAIPSSARSATRSAKSKPKHIRKANKRRQILLSKYRRGKITIEYFIHARYFPEPLFYIGHVDGPPPFCDVYFRADTHECISEV